MNVGSLHLIALVVRDVESNQELVEQMTDIIIIAKVEEENHEMQAMILNFALEISGAKAIYTNRINDSELFIEHFMD